MTVLAGARVVTPNGVRDPGWVEVVGSHIAAVGDGPPPSKPAIDLGGAWLLPGFIDLHVHGGGGHDFAASAADMAAGVFYHRSCGTTRTLVSLVSAPVDVLCEQLAWAAALAAGGPRSEGHVIGAHLEGPFLSHARCGAQNSSSLLLPDQAVLADLLVAGRGFVRSVTLAPELPGALELIDILIGQQIIAAVGHTDATYDQATAAFRRGATLATHLFNGMRPVHHREPGPVLAALDEHAACEVINDGVHVHSSVLRLVAGRGANMLVLVTDAIDATGVGDGRYSVGGQEVIVKDVEPRLASTGGLAGSTLTMDGAVRRAVLDTGLPVEVAAAAASTNPARVLGLSNDCGAISIGLSADMVVLDEHFAVQSVMCQGQWVIT